MGSEFVVKSAGQVEQWTSERCFIREVVNTAEIPEYSLAETRVEPGVTTELHALSVSEWYIIVRGTGVMEVDRAEGQTVSSGDVVIIPAGVAQRISNNGNEDRS